MSEILDTALAYRKNKVWQGTVKKSSILIKSRGCKSSCTAHLRPSDHFFFEVHITRPLLGFLPYNLARKGCVPCLGIVLAPIFSVVDAVIFWSYPIINKCLFVVLVEVELHITLATALQNSQRSAMLLGLSILWEAEILHILVKIKVITQVSNFHWRGKGFSESLKGTLLRRLGLARDPVSNSCLYFLPEQEVYLCS